MAIRSDTDGFTKSLDDAELDGSPWDRKLQRFWWHLVLKDIPKCSDPSTPLRGSYVVFCTWKLSLICFFELTTPALLNSLANRFSVRWLLFLSHARSDMGGAGQIEELTYSPITPWNSPLTHYFQRRRCAQAVPEKVKRGIPS